MQYKNGIAPPPKKNYPSYRTLFEDILGLNHVSNTRIQK